MKLIHAQIIWALVGAQYYWMLIYDDSVSCLVIHVTCFMPFIVH